jgi:hypothetical protein
LRDTLKPALAVVEDKRAVLREQTGMYSVKVAKAFDFDEAKKILAKKGYAKALADIEKVC